MRQLIGKYKVIQNSIITLTDIPGKYAGSRNHKIFGRLDCPSGLRLLKKENRVFFADWQDAIEAGYRTYQICHPEIPRLNERLGCFHPATEKLHVAIFDTNPRPYPKKPMVCFYVTILGRLPSSGNCKYTVSQIDLESWLPYPSAIKRAKKWGESLGLLVIDHFWRADYHVRYVPVTVTPEQIQARKKLCSRKKRMLTSVYAPEHIILRELLGKTQEIIATEQETLCIEKGTFYNLPA